MLTEVYNTVYDESPSRHVALLINAVSFYFCNRNCSCVWKIIAQAGLKIKFKVVDSFIEAAPSPNCNGDYAEVFDGKKLIELEHLANLRLAV